MSGSQRSLDLAPVRVDSDSEAFDRVLLRLASTDDAGLAEVLHRLLPILLARLSPGPAAAPPLSAEARASLLAVLAHVNVRVRGRADVALPFGVLLDLMLPTSSMEPSVLPAAPGAPFVLAYLQLGFPRLTPAAVDAALPQLLAVSRFPRAVREGLLQLAIRSLRHAVVPHDAAGRAQKFALLAAEPPDAKEALASLLIDTLLFRHRRPTAGLAQAEATPSAGLSLRAEARVLGVSVPASTSSTGRPALAAAVAAAALALTDEELCARKRAILRFVAACVAERGVVSASLPSFSSERGAEALPAIAATLFSDAHALSIGLAGLADGLDREGTAVLADDLLRRLVNADGALEGEAAVDALMGSVLGPPALRPDADPALDLRAPAPSPLRMRAAALCVRSRSLAMALPRSLRVVFACFFGGSEPRLPLHLRLQLRLTGLQLAQASFRLSIPSALAPFAPLFLKGLQRLLALVTSADEAEASEAPVGATSSLPAGSGVGGAGSGFVAILSARDAQLRVDVRARTYDTLAVLAERAPAVFVTTLAVPRLLFSCVASEAVARVGNGVGSGGSSSALLGAATALAAVASAFSFRAQRSEEHDGEESASRVPPLSAAVLEQLHALLGSLCFSAPEPAPVRVLLAALDWATRVFPFSDVRARFLCAALAGNASADVRAAARAGLRPVLSRAGTGEVGRPLPVSLSSALGREDDRDALDGIRRRADPWVRVAPEGAVQVSAEGEAEGEAEGGEFDVLADDHAFLRLAGLFPSFAALVAFVSAHDEREEESLQVAEGENASKRLRGEVADPPPSLSSSLAHLLGRHVKALSPMSLAALLELTNTSLDASAALAGRSAAQHVAALSGAEEGHGSLLQTHVALIEHSLQVDRPLPGADACRAAAASCLLQLMRAAPARLCALYAAPTRRRWLLQLVRDARSEVRVPAAVIVGTATASALPLDEGGLERDGGGDSTVAEMAVRLMKLASGGRATDEARSERSQRVESTVGALMALGVLLGRALRRAKAERGNKLAAAKFTGARAGAGRKLSTSPRFDDRLVAAATRCIASELGSRFAVIREAAAAALAAVARPLPLPLPAGDLAPLLRLVTALRQGRFEELAGAAATPAAEDTRADLLLRLFLVSTGAGDAAQRASMANAVSESDDEGTAEIGGAADAAALCIGALASGEIRGAALAADMDEGSFYSLSPASVAVVTPPPQLALAALACLMALSLRRSEGAAFTVGQALCEAATGQPAAARSEADRALALALVSPSGASTGTGTGAAAGLLPSLALAPSTLTALISGCEGEVAADDAVVLAERGLRQRVAGDLLDSVMRDALQSARAAERAAGAAWLLSLVQALALPAPVQVGTGDGGFGTVLAPRLALLQAAFVRLLGERAQLTQECAAKGLACVYEASLALGDARSQGQADNLVAQLLGVFTTGRPPGAGLFLLPLPSSTGVIVGDPAPAFEAEAGIGVGPTSFTAYRELCAMANEAGDPDLIYRFLALSSHHSLWNTRGGAGFALEALLRGRARRQLAPHLLRLVPRLFRFLYDPNERVQVAMARVWAALVRDPRRTLTRCLPAVFEELERASQSAAFREREAACAAACDALQGRVFAEVSVHLCPLWLASLRAADDVHEGVRKAGLALLRRLGRLALRLVDPQLTSRAEARAATGLLLPLLLDEAGGSMSAVPEVRQLSRATLAGCCRAAGPLLRPHVAALAEACLRSFSETEDSSLAYAQLHANAGTASMLGLNISGAAGAEALEASRIAATRRSPLFEVLDLVLLQLRGMSVDDLNGLTAGEVTGGLLGLLVERLQGLVLRAVGLPTRGAAARFICALVGAVGPLAMRPHAGALLRVLAACLEDSSPALRRDFGAAAAHCALCETRSAQLRAYVDILARLARNEDAGLRASAGLAVGSLLRYGGELVRVQLQPALVALCFVSRLDAEPAAGEVWTEAWAAIASAGGGEAQVARLWLAEIAAEISALLEVTAWANRIQAGTAAQRLVDLLIEGAVPSASELRHGVLPLPLLSAAAAAVAAAFLSPNISEGTGDSGYSDAMQQLLRPPQAPALVLLARSLSVRLAACLRGRAFDGKGALVGALAALLAHAGDAFEAPPAEMAAERPGSLSSLLLPHAAMLALAAATAQPRVPLGPMLAILAQQCSCVGCVAYGTAAARGLALVCLRFPRHDAAAFDLALVATAKVLRNLGALTPALEALHRADETAQPQSVDADIVSIGAITECAPVAAAGASSPAASVDAVATPQPLLRASQRKVLLGGRHDERTEGLARAAAKEEAEARGLQAAAALCALAAAFPLPPLPGGAGDANATMRTDALLDALFSAVRRATGLSERLQLLRAVAVVVAKCSRSQLEAACEITVPAVASTTSLLPALPALPPPSKVADVKVADVIVAELAAVAACEDRFALVRAAALSALAALAQRHQFFVVPPALGAPLRWSGSATSLVALRAAAESHAASSDPRTSEAARFLQRCAEALQ